MKKTKLYNYIQFSNVCQEYEILLTSDLKSTEIINYSSDLIFILKK